MAKPPIIKQQVATKEGGMQVRQRQQGQDRYDHRECGQPEGTPVLA